MQIQAWMSWNNVTDYCEAAAEVYIYLMVGVGGNMLQALND